MKHPYAYYRIIETIKCDSNLWHFALQEDYRITSCKIICFARIEYQDFDQDIITLALMINGNISPVDRIVGVPIGISGTSQIGEIPDWVRAKASEMIKARQAQEARKEEAKRKRAEKRAKRAMEIKLSSDPQVP